MTRSIATFTPAMIQAAALKCPLKLPGNPHGITRVDASTGWWFAYPAKTEVTKVYRKMCVDDLRKRQLVGGSYDGDVGHCVIGGKRFSLYPFSGYLVRDDFAQWAEANFATFWDAANHRERLPNAPQGDPVEVRADLKVWKDIRARALKLKTPTGLMREAAFNTLYDMKKTLAEYTIELERDAKAGRNYLSTRILADQLAATIAFRESKFADCIDFFMDAAADCLRCALWVQERYGAKPAGGAE